MSQRHTNTTQLEAELLITDQNGRGQICIKGLPPTFIIDTDTAANIIHDAEQEIDLRRRGAVGTVLFNIESDEYSLKIDEQYRK